MPETSEMLDAHPHLVRMDQAAPGRCDEEFYRAENIGRSQMQSFLEGIQTQSANGVLGDPTGSNAEAGREILELLAQGVASDAAFIHDEGTGRPGCPAVALSASATAVRHRRSGRRTDAARLGPGPRARVSRAARPRPAQRATASARRGSTQPGRGKWQV